MMSHEKLSYETKQMIIAKRFWKILKKGNLADLYEKVMGKWSEPKYKEPEEALNHLCTCLCPSHQKISDVIAKIGAINQVYAARVLTKDTYDLALLISLQGDEIEKAIEGKSLEAVEMIADSEGIPESIKTKLKENGYEQMHNHYSFASKYCSFHKPEAFPIYDGYLFAFAKLWLQNHEERKKAYGTIDDYKKYRDCIAEILEEYREKIGKDLDFKTLDQFLWMGMKMVEKGKPKNITEKTADQS